MNNYENQTMTRTANRSKNNILVTVICCAFVAGITLLGVYLFAPGVFGEAKDNMGESAPNVINQNDSITDGNNQNDTSFQPDNGVVENPEKGQNDTPFQPDDRFDINPENRPREDVPYDPVTGGRVSGRVNGDGTGQWSSDGGRSWSDTPPEGMPDPNNNQ